MYMYIRLSGTCTGISDYLGHPELSGTSQLIWDILEHSVTHHSHYSTIEIHMHLKPPFSVLKAGYPVCILILNSYSYSINFFVWTYISMLKATVCVIILHYLIRPSPCIQDIPVKMGHVLIEGNTHTVWTAAGGHCVCYHTPLFNQKSGQPPLFRTSLFKLGHISSEGNI